MALANNQLAYPAKVDRLLIRKKAVISVAQLTIDYIVQRLKDICDYHIRRLPGHTSRI
jgi:hypothetical protein